MSFKERLAEDLKDAMRLASTDPSQKVRVSTIRFLKAEIMNVEIQKKGELSDEEAMEVVQRQIKRRKESIEQYTKGGREELAAKEEAEIAVLSAYLPEQLSDEELVQIVEDAIRQTGASSPKEMGKIMGIVMPKVKGRADGRRINEVTLKLLQG